MPVLRIFVAHIANKTSEMGCAYPMPLLPAARLPYVIASLLLAISFGHTPISWAQQKPKTEKAAKPNPEKKAAPKPDPAPTTPVAQTDTLPAEDPFRLKLPSNFHLKILENRLQILVIEDPEVPLVTYTIGLRGGVFSQGVKYKGVPYLLEKLVPRPSLEHENSARFDAEWQQIAPFYHARLAADYLGLQLQVQQPVAEEGLRLLAKLLRYPRFDTVDVVEAKKHYTEQLMADEANPAIVLQQEVLKARWNGLAPLFDVRGSYSQVRDVSRIQLTQYHAQHMTPANTLLIIAGDIKHQEAFAWADSAFASWPNPYSVATEDVVLPRTPPVDTAFTLVSELAQVPTVVLSFPLPSVQANPKTYYTALVLSRLLSQRNNEFTRALQNNVLPYDLGCTYYPSLRQSHFQLNLTGSALDLRRSIIQLLAQIDTLNNPFYFSDKAIEQAKQTLEADYYFEQYPVDELSYKLLDMWSFHDLLRYKNYPNGIQAVNRFDLTFFIRDYLQFKPAITAVLLSSEQAELAGLDTLLANLSAIRQQVLKKPEPPQPAVPVSPAITASDSLPVAQNPSEKPAIGGGGYLALLQGAKPPDARDSSFAKFLGPDGTNPSIPVSQEELRAYRILFKINTADFDSTDKVVLGRVVDFVNQHPDLKVFINGHTDLSGPADYNLYLSFQRALIVKNYIKANYKCDFERLVVRGLGEQKPEFEEIDPEQAAKNRRVDFSTE